MRTNRLAVAALAVLAVFLPACANHSASSAGGAYGGGAYAGAASSTASSGSGAMASQPRNALLTIKKTKIGYVLANSKGDTLYWDSKDVKGSSNSACTGQCLSAWPPVTGMPAAASGIKLNGVLGTITRPGGVVQATYNGYPLYTYAQDTGPGIVDGNGVGGVWHVITGKVLTSSVPSGTGGAGGTAGSGSTGGSSGSGYGGGY